MLWNKDKVRCLSSKKMNNLISRSLYLSMAFRIYNNYIFDILFPIESQYKYLYSYQIIITGGMAEWLKAADCKSVDLAST